MRAWIVLVMLAGCTATPGPTTVHWTVSNDSAQPVAYTILVEGGAIAHEEDGSLHPSQVQRHTIMANGAELTATVASQDGSAEAVLASFAQPSCDHHQLRATWNGTWNLRWQSADCQ